MDTISEISSETNTGLNDVASRTALVLETNNLRGGADVQLVLNSLERVVGLLANQSLPLASLAQIVITHDGLDESSLKGLEDIAGHPVDFVKIEPTTGYYHAKNAGFAATDPERCRWVVFADADCVPAADWLAQLLYPFIGDETLAAVAGRTSYAPDLAGTALTTLDFMYFPGALADGATRNFYANNVVFRRDIFAEYHYQELESVYRAHCQVLGLQLQSQGIPLHYAARAHTVHRFPDSLKDIIKLRWLRGQDTCGLTPFLVRSYMPTGWQWLARSGPVGPLCVLIARLVFSVRALNKQDLPPLYGVRWLAAVILIVGFSVLDMGGALMRGLGVHYPRGKEGGDVQALSYHGSSK
ncbi:glycosyltransferase [Amphritea pacifica]|uniref:Glycosyltransferase family 2 protein n=1 Tax=Amphritea pacifica TaxID=2811233 RepID=A0ABS2W5W9_9GAMM|nr:glycosyltransferase family 2 protein [Amphritea pacifica]MBN0987107.1 glycosyltransferase family 2 protein [Amphritea pacifica]